MKSSTAALSVLAGLLLAGAYATTATAAEPPAIAANAADHQMRELLDAPLLFTKRHSYSGIHIYDTFYKWPPGGGGIYVIENPAAERGQWKIRAVIDPTTPETLGLGVYNDPELSWDATRLLFCFKGQPNGSTSIYEIGVDGRGLRRLTDPDTTLDRYKGAHGGQHDVTPTYLPDGRIAFLSTRPSGLVPCANSGVAILHVMDADGSDIHTISVNNVNEFDPCPMPRRTDPLRPLGIRRQERVDYPVAVDGQPRWHARDGPVRQQHGVPRSDSRRPTGPQFAPDRGYVCQTQLDPAGLDCHGRSPAGKERRSRHHQSRASGQTDLRPRRFVRAVAAVGGRRVVQRPSAGCEAQRD